MFRKSPGLCLLAAILAYLALWQLVPRATFLPAAMWAIEALLPFTSGALAACLSLVGAVLFITPTVAFMAAQIAIVYFFARTEPDLKRGALVLTLCLAGTQALMVVIAMQAGLGHYPTLREQVFILSHYFGPLKMPISLFFLLAATSIGCLVSLRIRDKNLLLPVVMFAAYVDFWTVTQGPVSTALKHAPEVVKAVSAPIPQAGTGVFVPVTTMGPGDPLFMALVFAAVSRLKMRPGRTFWFVLVAMTLGMVAVMCGLLDNVPLLTGSLPALMVLAVAVVAANWRQFKLSRQEAISTAVVALVLIASLPLIWSALKPSAEKKLKEKPKAPVTAPHAHGRSSC